MVPTAWSTVKRVNLECFHLISLVAVYGVPHDFWNASRWEDSNVHES